MCGRFAIAIRAETLRQVFGVADVAAEMLPRFNVAPGQDIAAIRVEDGEKRLVMLRWGFPVQFPGAPQAKPLINARGETVDTKPIFRDAFRNRRCLVPANGFYEWQAKGRGPKQPFFVRPKNGEPFAMAGIWERTKDVSGKSVDCVAIVTCEANAFLRPLHERMPVVLMPADWDVWLSGSPEEAKALIRTAPDDFFEAYPVGFGVNRAANEGPGLVLPAPTEQARTHRQRDLF